MSYIIQQRGAVAVVDAFEVAVGCAAGIVACSAVSFIRSAEIDANPIFGLVAVKNSVALVVARLADQPIEDVLASSGSKIRESASVPYRVRMLSFEMERQWTSSGLSTLVQRSMWANNPSMRGR